MAESKLKLIRIIQILKETDEQSPLTAPKICQKLALYGITAERKSVCRDINVLIDAGYKISLSADQRKGYYMSSHEFDDWELKVMMDAVLQARCITHEDTDILKEKLLSQTSERGRKRLKRIITIENRNKSNVSYAKEFMEILIEAMYLGRKVIFQYTDRNKHMERVLRREGYEYKVNPYTVVWQNETYYLICNLDKYDNLTHFRLDRLENLRVCKDEIARNPKDFLGDNPSIKIQEHVDTCINQFSGALIRLKLEYEGSDMNLLYDYAGENIRLIEKENGIFLVTLDVQNSDGLINWLMQCSQQFKVVEPIEVKEKLLSRLKQTLQKYE